MKTIVKVKNDLKTKDLLASGFIESNDDFFWFSDVHSNRKISIDFNSKVERKVQQFRLKYDKIGYRSQVKQQVKIV